MMRNVKKENWSGHEIRFVEKEGEWWAVAKDVADALGYTHAPHMLRMIDASAKAVHKVDTPGGAQESSVLSELGIYEAVFNSSKKEAKDFKLWVFEVIKTLRQAAGLEGFQVFRMMDKERQKEAMDKLRKGLDAAEKIDYIKANTIANKAVSLMHGHEKMLKKNDMPPAWLEKRQRVLEDVVHLMAANERFKLGLSVSKTIYGKHAP